MFRTPSLATPPAVSKNLVANWTAQRRPLFSRLHESSPSCIVSPIHYEPGYAYPLVVWLHGPNSSELELRQVMTLVSVRNYVGVAPRGTLRTSLTRELYSWRHTPADVADTCQRVRDCMDLARERFNLHDERVFIAGHDAGGTMALRVGMEHPELFAGAISLGGRVPRGGNAFRRIKAARRLPLLLSISPCESFSASQIMDDLKLLHSGGFSLDLRIYPEGDSLTNLMFLDLDKWIMGQICPTAVTAS